MEKTTKWILDTDCGLDDAQAVFLALHYLDLVAITWVNGNTTVDNVVKNVAIISGVKGKDVPIFKGMSLPIMRKQIDGSLYHAADGFGGVQEEWLHRAKLENIQKEHAVHAIIRIVNEEYEKGNDVGICAIGPLTNLALAIRFEPEIIPKLKYVYLMGGTMSGYGNMSLTAEFNFYLDPEAAKIVVDNIPKISLLPWETAFGFHVTKEDQLRLLREDNECGKLFKSINWFADQSIDGRIYWCDGLWMAAAINPSVVNKSHTAYGEVTTEGSHFGAIFYNMHPEFVPQSAPSNITQLIEIDHDSYIDMLEQALELPKMDGSK